MYLASRSAATPCRLARARSLLLPLLAVLRCDGLYDPVHRTASARIYGNIDAYAYYFVDLIVGSPPQRVSVIVDTGSGVTAFPCKSCRHCGTHIDPAFDFSGSSTAKWTPCGRGCGGTCRNGHCAYHQGYTEGSSISGWWFQDLVRLGDTIQRNPPVSTSLGCHQDENRLFYTQKANGILGIRPPGRGAPTLLQQLFADHAHIDGAVFSLCFAEWGGRIVVGGYNASYHAGPITYVALSTGSGYYGVPLSSMRVAGQEVAGHFGHAMIDSGTTYVYMASQPYRSLRGAIEGYCRQHSGCGARLLGTCWEVPVQAGLSGFPTIEVLFSGVPTSWVPGAYLYRKAATRRWCYAFEDDGPRANTVLGAAWMLNQEVIFDLRGGRVGIAPARCPEFRGRPAHDPRADLTLPTAPPAGPPTQGSPAVAATGAAAPAAAPGAPAAAPATPAAGPRYVVRPVEAGAVPGPPLDPQPLYMRGPYLVVGAGVAAILSSILLCTWAIRRCRGEGAGEAEPEKAERAGQGVPPAVVGADMDDKGGDQELSGEEDPLVAAIQDEF